jgi:DNA repair exonuclease SbcCD ATPase subunit
MKNKSVKRMNFFGIVLFISVPLFAQQPIDIQEIQCTFSHGEYPGISLTIPETSYDAISKSWVKIIEKGTKSAVAVVNGEYSIFGAQLPEISEDPVNVYSVIRSRDTAIVLEVSIELKPKEFLSRTQSEKEFAQVQDFLFQFGKDEYTIVATEQLKNEEKALKSLEKELSDLQNSKTKLEKEIVEEQNNILNYNDKIDLLKQDASFLNDQIGQENKTLLSLKDEEAKKEKESQIKNIEKEKKQILNEIEKLQKKTIDSNSNIQTAEMDIETNINDQVGKTGEIDQQKQVVEKATGKLNTIIAY